MNGMDGWGDTEWAAGEMKTSVKTYLHNIYASMYISSSPIIISD